jgi:gas vesicle protein
MVLMRIGRYESAEKGSVGTAVTFLMIGLGAGALVALVLAPKSGKQLRRDLRRRVEDAREAIQDWSDDAKDRVQDAVDRSSEWAEELREATREKTAPIGRALRRD